MIESFRSIVSRIRAVNESINHTLYEQWRRNEMPIFGVGQFRAFVFSGPFIVINANDAGV